MNAAVVLTVEVWLVVLGLVCLIAWAAHFYVTVQGSVDALNEFLEDDDFDS